MQHSSILQTIQTRTTPKRVSTGGRTCVCVHVCVYVNVCVRICIPLCVRTRLYDVIMKLHEFYLYVDIVLFIFDF